MLVVAGLPSRESAVDKPTPTRAEDIEAHKAAKLFGDNPRLESIIEAVSGAVVLVLLFF